jgi:hypothetical protein
MRFSITTLLLATAVTALGAAAVVNRTSLERLRRKCRCGPDEPRHLRCRPSGPTTRNKNCRINGGTSYETWFANRQVKAVILPSFTAMR